MTPQHTMRVVQVLEAFDAFEVIKLADFIVDITVNLIPENRDGWSEPLQPHFAEFASVVQIEGPHCLGSVELVKWAERWVDAHQNRIWLEVRASEAF
jgi:hypothetical protein